VFTYSSEASLAGRVVGRSCWALHRCRLLQPSQRMRRVEVRQRDSASGNDAAKQRRLLGPSRFASRENEGPDPEFMRAVISLGRLRIA
jgi:hypothetical protein